MREATNDMMRRLGMIELKPGVWKPKSEITELREARRARGPVPSARKDRRARLR